MLNGTVLTYIPVISAFNEILGVFSSNTNRDLEELDGIPADRNQINCLVLDLNSRLN